MEELVNKLKVSLIEKLTQNEQISNEKYLVAGNKSYTRQNIADEIQNETEFGVDFLTNMLMLAIDLTARQKV
jgi:hypothetical protein